MESAEVSSGPDPHLPARRGTNRCSRLLTTRLAAAAIKVPASRIHHDWSSKMRHLRKTILTLALCLRRVLRCSAQAALAQALQGSPAASTSNGALTIRSAVRLLPMWFSDF